MVCVCQSNDFGHMIQKETCQLFFNLGKIIIVLVFEWELTYQIDIYVSIFFISLALKWPSGHSSTIWPNKSRADPVVLRHLHLLTGHTQALEHLRIRLQQTQEILLCL